MGPIAFVCDCSDPQLMRPGFIDLSKGRTLVGRPPSYCSMFRVFRVKASMPSWPGAAISHRREVSPSNHPILWKIHPPLPCSRYWVPRAPSTSEGIWALQTHPSPTFSGGTWSPRGCMVYDPLPRGPTHLHGHQRERGSATQRGSEDAGTRHGRKGKSCGCQLKGSVDP